MPRPDSETDSLITLNRIARLLGVERSTPSNWRRRHPDSPQPVLGERTRVLFRRSEWVEWLSTRRIPADQLLADEPPNTTYGDRLRHNLALERDGSTPPQPTLLNDEQLSTQLHQLDQQRRRLRGVGVSDREFLEAAQLLTYLATCAPDQWQRIATTADGGRIDAVAKLADEVLRVNELPTGAKPILGPLSAGHRTELATLAGRCAQVGARGFDLLFDRMAHLVDRGSAGYITPGPVMDLMAGLATSGRDARVVFDPYARGGELLAAVLTKAAALTGADRVAHGIGVDPAMVRLAGMRLAVHGRRSRLRVGDSTPWTHPVTRLADTVVTNPVFNQRSEPAAKSSARKQPYGESPAHNDNFSWLQYAVTSLTDDGRAVLLLPELAAASSDARERKIRTALVDEGAVTAVIALGDNSLVSTNAMIWVVEPRQRAANRILFIDARPMTDPNAGSKTRSSLIGVADIARIFADRSVLRTDEPTALEHGGFAMAASVDTVRREGYSLHPGDYVRRGRDRRATNENPQTRATFERIHTVRDRLLAAADSAKQVVSEYDWIDRSHANASTNWAERRLRDICEITAGPSHSRFRGVTMCTCAEDVGRALPASSGAPARSATECENGGVTMVVAKHLRGQRLVFDEAQHLPPASVAELSRFSLSPGDLVIARTGTISEPAMVLPEQRDFIYHTGLIRIRVLEPRDLDPWYLLAALSAPTSMARIREAAGRKQISSVSAVDLGSVELMIPPIAEQIAIGVAARAINTQLSALRAATAATAAFRDITVQRLVTGTVAAGRS